jgi:hypothetical protein
MTSQMILIRAEPVRYDYRSSAERDNERLRYGYRIGPEGDRK